MITILCSCGQSFDVNPLAIKKPQACPSCGQLAVCLCAENLPADGGEGDFDAVLVKKGGPKVPGAPNISAYALGGCVNLAIGRLPDNNLSLNSNKVSRKHATLVRVDFGPSRWQIVDNNSSGGVFVNGEKVQEHDLSPGDEIVIGDYKFEYVVAGASGGVGESMLPQQEEYVQAQQAPSYQAQQAGGNIFTNWKIMGPAAAGVVILIGGLIYALSGSGASKNTESKPKTPPIAQNLVMPPSEEPAIPRSSDNTQAAGLARSKSIKSASNLWKIALYILLYKAEKNSYPTSLGDLATLPDIELDAFLKINDPLPPDDIKTDPKLLVDWINQNTCYVFTGSQRPSGIAAYEKEAFYLADRINAAMSDGSVQNLTPEQLKQMLAAPAEATASAIKPPEQPPKPPVETAAIRTSPQAKTQFLTQAEFKALPKTKMPSSSPLSKDSVEMTQLAKNDVEPDFRLSMDELAKDSGYETNPNKPVPSVNYIDKKLELRGIIDSVDTMLTVSIRITGQGKTKNNFRVSVSLSPKDRRYLNNLSPGQEIIVRGTSAAGISNPKIVDSLKNPEIVALGPDTAFSTTVDGLLKEYAANSAATEKKYNGKCVQLQGTFTPKSTENSYTLTDSAGNSIDIMANSQDVAGKKRNVVQTATVKGKLDFTDGKISLYKGWFLIDP